MEQTSTAAIRKEKSDWYIAAVFFIVAGLLVPWVIGYVAATIYFAGVSKFFSIAGFGGGVVALLLTSIGIYFSAQHVSKYVTRHYVIRSRKRIALIATGYFIALIFPWSLYQTSSFITDAGLQGAAPLLLGFRLLALCTFASVLHESIKHALSR